MSEEPVKTRPAVPRATAWWPATWSTGRGKPTTLQPLVCPAAYHNEVASVSCQVGDLHRPARVELIVSGDGGYHVQRLPTDRLYVWSRAGRVSFTDADGGAKTDLTLLGRREAAGRAIGDPWPPTKHGSRIISVLAGAVRDIAIALTLPFAMGRMVRTSSRRHGAVDALEAWCKRAIPHIDVLYHAQQGAEHTAPGQLPPSRRRGLIGRPGWEDAPLDARHNPQPRSPGETTD